MSITDQVLVFDVNSTLLDLSVPDTRFERLFGWAPTKLNQPVRADINVTLVNPIIN